MSKASRTAQAFLTKLLVVAVALTAATSTARACSCMATTLPRALEGATAVFEGLVTQVDEVKGTGNVPSARRASFKLVRVWKGPDDVEQVSVRTPLTSAACGVPFEQGVSYLVFAHGDPEALEVSLCSRTQRTLDAEEDLAALGAGITPVNVASEEPVTEGESTPLGQADEGRGGCASCTALGAGVPPGSATLGIGLLGWMLLRRRR